jgi:hypothetical protein
MWDDEKQCQNATALQWSRYTALQLDGPTKSAAERLDT